MCQDVSNLYEKSHVFERTLGAQQLIHDIFLWVPTRLLDETFRAYGKKLELNVILNNIFSVFNIFATIICIVRRLFFPPESQN